MNTTTSKKQ